MSWNKLPTIGGSPSEDLLAGLPGTFRSALLSMYNGEPQVGSDGERYSIERDVRISIEQGMWLYNLCRERSSKTTLEIGLAYGYSTLYFLAALHQNGFGQHTAIDPSQSGFWHGIGLQHARSLQMSDRFRCVEEKSAAALVHLADRGEAFDVIFIDGAHRFDDVLTDFTLAAGLTPSGGCIVLDDMWMPSIRRAVAFIRSNRKDFDEIATPVANIAVFERVGEDARIWTHYTEFCDPFDARGAIRRLTPAPLRRSAKAIARLMRA